VREQKRGPLAELKLTRNSAIQEKETGALTLIKIKKTSMKVRKAGGGPRGSLTEMKRNGDDFSAATKGGQLNTHAKRAFSRRGILLS